MANTSGQSDYLLVPITTFKSVGTTAVQINTAVTNVQWKAFTFTVEANSGNTGVIFVGSSTVDSSACIHLSGGDAFTAPALYAGGTNLMQYDLTTWYLRASAASQKVSITRIVKGQQLS